MPRLKPSTLYGWLLFAPAGVMLTLFAFTPTVASFWQSLFSRGTARRPSRFVGLDNYDAMLADPVFWQVAKNSLWYALGTIPTSIAIALGMALWVNSKLPARTLVRMAYFTPTILPMIAAANIWLFFYTPDIGLLDQIGRGLGLGGHNWLGHPSTALWAIIVVTVWKEAGFFMIFYLAALQTIPPDLKDAAAIEGAGRWIWFRRVVFPLLMPTTLFVLVNAMIPRPGETGGEWWEATGQAEARAKLAAEEGRTIVPGVDPVQDFLHDLPEDVRAAALRRGEPPQSTTPFVTPFPLDRWPDVPTPGCRRPRRPLLPSGLPAPHRRGAARHHPGRSPRRPPRRAGTPAGTGRPAGQLLARPRRLRVGRRGGVRSRRDHYPSHHRSTRIARSVTQREGKPCPSSTSNQTRPGRLQSRGQLPSSRRWDRT